MLYDLYKREVEERTREETLRLAEEWDKLTPEEKSQQAIADFFRSKWGQPGKKR